uniref:Transmembrane ascorbate-dependent reductase CYB561 n=1 Tax=Canis lupus familiaris TaxID=9615 RepID=A0A8P0TP46_CANLF
ARGGARGRGGSGEEEGVEGIRKRGAQAEARRRLSRRQPLPSAPGSVPVPGPVPAPLPRSARGLRVRPGQEVPTRGPQPPAPLHAARVASPGSRRLPELGSRRPGSRWARCGPRGAASRFGPGQRRAASRAPRTSGGTSGALGVTRAAPPHAAPAAAARRHGDAVASAPGAGGGVRAAGGTGRAAGARRGELAGRGAVWCCAAGTSSGPGARPALLVYRVFRNEAKRTTKVLHGLLHVLALIIALVGLVAVFDYHRQKGYADLYSLHSWCGILVFVLYFMQWLVGFSFFLFPGASFSLRSRYRPQHVFFGATIFVLSLGTALLGLKEALLFKLGAKYSTFEAEGVLANVLGLLLASFGVTVLYILTRADWKRPPQAEEQALSMDFKTLTEGDSPSSQ